MKKIIVTNLLCTMILFLLCACSSSTQENKDMEVIENNVIVIETPEPEPEPEIILYTNPLTGETSENEPKGRPLIASYDNVGSAVPQSWTSMADIIYEFPVEGNQTRLQAIFYNEYPEYLGPIRSARPYFVDLAREYKAIHLAHGWSEDAKHYLYSGVVPYINAMNTDCSFYRVNDKTAPHNSYIMWSEVKAEIERKGWWDEQQEIRPFTFLTKDEKNTGTAVNYIEFDSALHCEFTYDSENNYYVRTINDGHPYIDHETGQPVTVSNVIVQKVYSTILDSEGRLQINMCSGGDALLFTNGVVIEGTWARDSLDSRTVFTDINGNEFKLTVGNSWIMIADQRTSINY